MLRGDLSSDTDFSFISRLHCSLRIRNCQWCIDPHLFANLHHKQEFYPAYPWAPLYPHHYCGRNLRLEMIKHCHKVVDGKRMK